VGEEKENEGSEVGIKLRGGELLAYTSTAAVEILLTAA
jgi:hypothetical protein